jgi:hypothetical protein
MMGAKNSFGIGHSDGRTKAPHPAVYQLLNSAYYTFVSDLRAEDSKLESGTNRGCEVMSHVVSDNVEEVGWGRGRSPGQYSRPVPTLDHSPTTGQAAPTPTTNSPSWNVIVSLIGS